MLKLAGTPVTLEISRTSSIYAFSWTLKRKWKPKNAQIDWITFLVWGTVLNFSRHFSFFCAIFRFWRNCHSRTLFEKSIFCPKIQFWENPNIFTSFSPQIFLTIFLVKSKLSTAKKPKTTTFSRVFHPKKKIDNFLGKSKLVFWTKNEDFELDLQFWRENSITESFQYDF